jgi:manganese/zinc/iron transport system permease protein
VIAVVVGLQAVGVVLMSAMIVAPGAAARQWTDRLSMMVILSAIFGAVSGIAGAMISSLSTGLPTGPTIVMVISAIVIVSFLFAPNRGMLWAYLRQRRNSRRLRTAAVLEALYEMGMHHGDPLRPHTLRSVRAAIPGRGVRYTLQRLAGEGLVHVDGELWSLTPLGVNQAQSIAGITPREITGVAS